MAIKEYIYLLGVEDVEASLKRLTDQGEQALGQFRELGGAGGAEPFAPVTEGSKAAADATQGLTLKAHDLRGAMYILRPVLQAAGIQVGELGTLARLANVGIAGIAAAAAGAVVVGLARLEDAARTTKGQLDDLFQSKALSEKAFAGIQASALQFNTTVQSIVPGVEALKVAWDRFITETRTFKFVAPTGGADIGQIIPPGIIGSVESLQKAYDNFLKLLRAGRLDQAGATEAAKTFFTAMQSGGKLTADILRTLPVGTINLLAQAMGKGQLSTQQFINEVKLAPITMDRLLEALNRFGLESDQAFRDNAIITYRDKLGEILNTLSEGFKSLTGVSFSDFIVSQLEGIRKGIKDTREELEWIKGWITWIEQHTEMPGMGKLVQDLKALADVGPGGAFGGTAEELNKIWDTVGTKAESAADRFKKGWRDAPKIIEDMGQTIAKDVEESAAQIQKAWTITGPTGILPTWEELLQVLERIKSIQLPNLISPAGAAEVTPGTSLLTQPTTTAPTTESLVAPFQEADNQIRTIWIALMDYIGTAITEVDFSQLTQALVSPFINALPGIRDALLQVEQMIEEIMREVAAAAGAIQQLNQGGRPGGGGGVEAASGGYIRGPGTSTSDSILSWLSDREYVINARAVSHYGTSLFNALNSMRLPRDIFGPMPRFAQGGMVPATVSGTPVTLVIDRQSFNMTAGDDTISRLKRYAVASQLSSTGRKPRWVR